MMTGSGRPILPVTEEYLADLQRRIARDRVPATGSIDLTHRCNLECLHCYLSGGKGEEAIPPSRELGTERWLSIIDEIAAAGCLNFLITGGEPFLRPDFGDIYRRAKERGLLVTVFTNGTMITDSLLDLFGELPPQAVEISLYGATAATCEAITGVTGSYEKCLTGIRRLLDRGVNLTLKTMLLASNREEWHDIEAMAHGFGVDFRLDAALFPCFDGSRMPLDQRVSPDEAVAMEFSDPERARRWREYYEKRKNIAVEEGLYLCGAGLTNFHIDPDGTLRPCLMAKKPAYDLAGGNFRSGWEVISSLRDLKPGPENECRRCEKRVLCGLCPAFSELESGDAEERSEYLCRTGELRYRAIVDGMDSVSQI